MKRFEDLSKEEQLAIIEQLKMQREEEEVQELMEDESEM